MTPYDCGHLNSSADRLNSSKDISFTSKLPCKVINRFSFLDSRLDVEGGEAEKEIKGAGQPRLGGGVLVGWGDCDLR